MIIRKNTKRNNMELEFTMDISDAAKKHMAEMLEKRGKPSAGIRVGVKKGGCAGLSYTLAFADVKNPDDETIEISYDGKAFKVITSEEYMPFITGLELDFAETLEGSGFVFNNPNAKGSCGCGKSFCG